MEQQDSGIYYLIGDAIPIQLVIVPKLSKEHNYWLNNLRNDLKAGSEIKNFIENYGKNKNSKLYQSLADAVMRANWEKLKEGSNMCEALKELFADDLRESREQGIIEGRIYDGSTVTIDIDAEGNYDAQVDNHGKDVDLPDGAAELLEEANSFLNEVEGEE